jgi:CubicO group peptidase (beta-lactamase class C family)
VPDYERLTERVGKYLQTTGVPAFAFGIVHGSELAYAQGFGSIVSDDGSRRLVSADTLFPSCSTAKPITATLIMRLVERGLLHLDEPILRHLPWLVFPDGGDASRVTLRHLLSHTSGLSSDTDVPERFFSGSQHCLEEHVRHDVPSYKAAGNPGDVFWYSNAGFNIAGLLAERVTGMPFVDLAEDLVFSPASMASTSFDPAAHKLAGITLDTVDDPRRPAIPYPAGGAVTTIQDLGKFSISHMQGGRLPVGRLLNEQTVRIMHEMQADAYTRQPRWYGLGFDIEYHKGRKLVTHGGGGFGCGSTFVMVPEEKLAFIALFNHPAGHGVTARSILDEVLGLSDSPEQKVKHADTTMWSSHCGTYRNLWPDCGGGPSEVTVTATANALQLIFDGQVHSLVSEEEPVYATKDGGVSVGFVPGGEFLMLDDFGIGLVSAWPYKKVGHKE